MRAVLKLCGIFACLIVILLLFYTSYPDNVSINGGRNTELRSVEMEVDNTIPDEITFQKPSIVTENTILFNFQFLDNLENPIFINLKKSIFNNNQKRYNFKFDKSVTNNKIYLSNSIYKEESLGVFTLDVLKLPINQCLNI